MKVAAPGVAAPAIVPLGRGSSRAAPRVAGAGAVAETLCFTFVMSDSGVMAALGYLVAPCVPLGILGDVNTSPTSRRVGPAYRVRAAASDDLRAVLDVLAENQATRPARWVPEHTSPSDVQVAMWDRIMSSSGVTVYLAEEAGEPVGTACLSILPNLTYDCRPTAFIEAVVVRYRHRRRGVARLLLGRALQDARSESCFKVQLLTHKRHASDGAHDLYRALGFVAEAEGFRLYLDAR